MFQAPYRAAVIGRTGRGDYGHGLDVAFLDQPKMALVAVADEHPSGRAAAAKRLRVERSYADYREMLEKEKPHFVAIGPRWLDCHRDMILACAEHGVVGILCEKPLAPDLAACDAIVRGCEQSHVKLAMAFQTRYSPRLSRVREIIEAGSLGELLELRGRGKEDRRGGGEDLMVLGTHVMNLFHTLLGEPAWCSARVGERGRAATLADVREGAEGIGPLAGDRIDATFGFRGTSVVAHFATSRPKEPGGRFGLVICGSKGCIAMGTGWLPSVLWLDDPTWLGAGKDRWRAINSAGPGEPQAAGADDLVIGNRAILADLVEAVEDDRQPLASGYAGRTAIEMILACYISHLRRGVVDWPLADRAVHPLAGPRPA